VSASHPTRERGFALILVLWLSLALAAVAICFGHVALLGHRTQGGVVASLQCRQTIRAASEYVKALLGTVEDGQMPELADEDTQKVVVGNGAFWLVAPIWSDRSELAYGLIPESGKLNLNTATADMLQGLPGVTEAIAAAIVDWRDENGEAEAYGAEDETYSRKDPPYRAKNGDFESVEELLLVEGVDEDLLYGKDRNQNGVIDPWEDDDSSAGDTDLGIWHLVTVSSAEPNTQGSSQSGGSQQGQQSGRTNVTETQSLRSYLSQKFGAEKANQAASAAPYGSVLEFAARSGLTRDEFRQVEGDLTASDEDAVKGLVNVNVAPRAVLRCLPGVGDEGAEKVISYRTANSDELTSVSWLLDALGPESAKELGPHVTVKTYQISADVVAVGNLRRAVRRVRLIFDLSSGSPVLVSRRDLSTMAWPLEQDLWDELGSDPLTDDSE
jgi:DNA uptake protein ComE-like DNA-binding protein